MMFRSTILISLLAITQVAGFVPAMPNGPKSPSSPAVKPSSTAACASGDNIFAKLSEAAANPKLAISKAIAGEYDESSAKAKVESLIADTPVLMFSFTT
mmetsp:Transcript_3540/g.10117  ORF Transcript_3540/g.10117 Transcript_3540/m.10117 type:complete len:99 (-) Transcript_3540:586-882(-)